MNVEELVNEYVNKCTDNEERRRRLAVDFTRRVQHAMDVLDSTPIGEKVVFEGSCPSGPTYEGETLWDGTDDTRTEIARRAMRHGGGHAWSAWLRPVRQVENGIFQAKMRTG